ncbi:SDR family oxidoreductase [Agrobacterium rubi]|uniref:SDR family NAD(P)-dependent oxidoreductase n=1 Tax=Agrobacterium rubi TaxID=28099 RepID=UPI001574BC33|nr:SDR family oxidoreductase [Agrobacterium rubi]NTF10583.1 SDR family oxidoreductase [Agrobacterium rubi]NTF22977.1 SDR family oxidoreductase [Agrobacterium rubi]NTF29908.1 SDR family oxidoreductase [Agrobacterium rubi]
MMARTAQGTVLVTGAGSGIGRAIAHRLAQDGFAVGVNDLHIADAQIVVDEIVEKGGRAVACAGDVSSEADVENIYDTTIKSFGSIEALVNNAGFAHQAPIEKLTLEDFDRMFAVHVRGSFLMIRKVISEMLERGSGSIVNITSQLAQIGGAEVSHYAGAKAAVIGMTKSIAREVSSRGVRINAVAPGPINTPLIADFDPAWIKAKKASLPLGRFGEPEDVAATVSFLLSAEAVLFVGQTLGPNSGDVML